MVSWSPSGVFRVRGGDGPGGFRTAWGSTRAWNNMKLLRPRNTAEQGSGFRHV